jgi:hypothetical protein
MPALIEKYKPFFLVMAIENNFKKCTGNKFYKEAVRFSQGNTTII